MHRLAESSIARAFAISIGFHAALFSSMEIGSRVGLLSPRFRPSRLLAANLSPAQLKLLEQPRKEQQKKQEPEVPLVFVDVDPANAAPEPPKTAKYYSSANSAAGNPKPKTETQTPRVEGSQTKVAKTTPDVRITPTPIPPAPKVEPQKKELEPTPPPPAPQPPPQPSVMQPATQAPKPAPAPAPTVQPKGQPLPPGETIVAKASPTAKPLPQNRGEAKPEPPAAATTPPKTRPRTLAAARAQKGLPGERMEQQGGVRRETLEASLDVRATPFGAYDAAFIAAVRARWYTLLDERNTPATTPGSVVLEFRLTQEGRITNMHVVSSSVNEILSWLCQRAITDPSPYQRFPSDLRRLLGVDYRDVRFTFHYN